MASADELFQEGLGLHRKGSLQEASALYARALQLNPANAELHYYAGALSLQQGAADAAIKSAQNAIALNSGFARAHGLLGRSFIRLGRHADALASLNQALSIAPG